MNGGTGRVGHNPVQCRTGKPIFKMTSLPWLSQAPVGGVILPDPLILCRKLSTCEQMEEATWATRGLFGPS